MFIKSSLFYKNIEGKRIGKMNFSLNGFLNKKSGILNNKSNLNIFDAITSYTLMTTPYANVFFCFYR